MMRTRIGTGSEIADIHRHLIIAVKDLCQRTTAHVKASSMRKGLSGNQWGKGWLRKCEPV
jgi:hypothetical protein